MPVCTVTTAGRSSSTTRSSPPSTSCWTSSASPVFSIRVASATCGTPSSAASMPPRLRVRAVAAHRAREDEVERAPLAVAAARVVATAKGSRAGTSGSSARTWSASSAPIASARRRTSSSSSPPTVRASTEPPWASRRRRASSTAKASHSFRPQVRSASSMVRARAGDRDVGFRHVRDPLDADHDVHGPSVDGRYASTQPVPFSSSARATSSARSIDLHRFGAPGRLDGVFQVDQAEGTGRHDDLGPGLRGHLHPPLPHPRARSRPRRRGRATRRRSRRTGFDSAPSPPSSRRGRRAPPGARRTRRPSAPR